MRPSALIAGFVLAASSVAAAQAGPDGKGGNVMLHLDALTLAPQHVPGGINLDWGAFNNRYLAAGGRLGVVFIDGQYQFLLANSTQIHIPIGDVAVIVPALNPGLYLPTGAFGVSFSCAGTLKFSDFYVGAEFETFIFLSGHTTLFPGPHLVGLVAGMYY